MGARAAGVGLGEEAARAGVQGRVDLDRRHLTAARRPRGSPARRRSPCRCQLQQVIAVAQAEHRVREHVRVRALTVA